MKMFNLHKIGLVALVLFAGSFSLANAQSALDVDFENDPLFENADVKPGDQVTRTVTVSNLGDEVETVRVSSRNEYSDGLDEVMNLAITEGPNTYFDGSFKDFFITAPVDMGVLNPGDNKTYDFTAYFDINAGNQYQGTTMQFDLCVGFSGSSAKCDNGDDGNGNDGDGNGSSGGGGGGPNVSLVEDLRLFNEELELEGETSIVLSWNSNLDATTYLVCGDVANGPFTLDTDEPFLGYEFDVSENTTLKTDHYATLNNLDPGTYECVPAGREDTDDGFTTGDELEFTITPEGQVQGETTQTGRGGSFMPTSEVYATTKGRPVEGAGDTLGAATGTGSATSSMGTVSNQISRTTGTVGTLLSSDNCKLWWLLLLIVILLGFSFYEDWLKNDQNVFWSIFKRNALFSLVYVVALFFTQYAGLLESVWWVFAGLWVLVAGIDYLAHQKLYSNTPNYYRHIWYGATSLIFMLTSLVWNFPCVWWPFFLIFIATIILFFFSDKENENIN